MAKLDCFAKKVYEIIWHKHTCDYSFLRNKVEGAFPMVISDSEFRIGQQIDDDHGEDVPHIMSATSNFPFFTCNSATLRIWFVNYFLYISINTI